MKNVGEQFPKKQTRTLTAFCVVLIGKNAGANQGSTHVTDGASIFQFEGSKFEL